MLGAMVSSPVPDHVARLRPLQLLTLTIGAGTVMFTATRVFIEPQVNTPPVLFVLIVLAALIGAAVAIRAYGYAVPALPTGLPRENAVETSLRYFASTTVLRTTLSEVPFFVAFFLSLLEPRSWLLVLVALPGVVALFWIHAWPSARTAAAIEDGLEREGAQSFLREALGLR